MIDISVILTVQTEKNIDKTIDSILSQNFKNFEIICINTTEDTNVLQTLNFYKEKDNRINILNTTSNNLEQTLSQTIKELKGKYVSFINNEDYISEDFYQKLYTAAKEQTDVVVECTNLQNKYSKNSDTLLNKLISISLLHKNYKTNIPGFQTFEKSLLKQVLFYYPQTIYANEGVCVKNSKDILLTQKKDDVLISLTSFPARIKIVHKTIETLLNQTLKADKVILWLAESQFPNKEKDLPNKLLSLTKKGLSINWYHKDIRSYKKLIPTLIEYPNATIITSDDDILYDSKWLETLYLPYIINQTQTIYCHRAHQILFDENNEIKKYTDWNFNISSDTSSYNLLFTGVGGVLYPPHSLHKDTTNENLFTSLCPHADDLWFWAMALLNHTKIQPINVYKSKLKTILGSQTTALCHDNVRNGRNDIQLNNLLSHYSEIYELLDHNLPSLEKKRKYKTINILGFKIKIKTGIKPLKIIKNYFVK